VKSKNPIITIGKMLSVHPSSAPDVVPSPVLSFS